MKNRRIEPYIGEFDAGGMKMVEEDILEINPYEMPNSSLHSNFETDSNNSGMRDERIPPGIKGWSWGAFLLNWIWAIFNKSWLGLVCLIPVVGLFMMFVLGFKGREWAWKKKRWESIEHFNKTQKRWSIWGFVLVVVPMVAIMVSVAIPAYQDYVVRVGLG